MPFCLAALQRKRRISLTHEDQMHARIVVITYTYDAAADVVAAGSTVGHILELDLGAVAAHYRTVLAAYALSYGLQREPVARRYLGIPRTLRDELGKRCRLIVVKIHQLDLERIGIVRRAPDTLGVDHAVHLMNLDRIGVCLRDAHVFDIGIESYLGRSLVACIYVVARITRRGAYRSGTRIERNGKCSRSAAVKARDILFDPDRITAVER